MTPDKFLAYRSILFMELISCLGKEDFFLFQCVFNVVKDVGLVLEEMAEGETIDSIKKATSASFEVC